MMKLKKYLKYVSGLALGPVLLYSGAQAQEDVKLDEVVISTTKNDQKQSQTGKVVTLIGQEVLSRSHGRNLTDLLNEQAGIVVSGASGNLGLNKSVFVRGASGAYAVILIDGVLVSSPVGNGSAFDLRMFSIDQIDHIEILKGGQSTIYGSDAVSGVINIITKKGKKAGNSVYGVGSYGSYESFKGTIGMSSQVKDFSYNIAYTQAKTNGISEAALPAGQETPFEKDGNKTAAVNANFSLQASKQLSINPFIRYSYGHYDFDANAFEDHLENNYKLKYFNGGVNTQYEHASGKVTFNYSYENASTDSQSQYGTSLSQGSTQVIDFYLNQGIGQHVKVLAGLDNRSTTFKLNAAVPPATNLFSTYGSVFLHDLGMFNLEVGGRYNKHKQYGENSTYNITPSIQLLRALKIYGTISTAFKAPTLENLFGEFGANLELKPETSRNYEAGINLSFVNDHYTLRLAGFKRDLRDAIVYGNIGFINQASQQAKGFEIEPAAKFGKFKVNGYYAYVDGTEFNYITNEVSDYLVRKAKHVFGLNAGLQLNEKLYISSAFKYNGKRKDGDFNAYAVVNLPAYQLLDFYAEYALLDKRLKVFADFKNIFKEKYTEFYGYSSMGFNMNAGISFNIR
ncbi:vitamin B12 transporter [Pedobacter sp. CAN_A7]|uniref:TonB-dependent receptor plug domain-containing protein n=1 Tax=Pedobacter sp. CAN_A7 TaxID=2787722 RepID=UPI0018CAA059